MTERKIKNIIFDLGGVICDLLPDRCIAEFKKIGCDKDILPQQYSLFEGIFQQIDRGTMTIPDFYDAVRRESGVADVTNEQIRDAWTSLLGPIPDERFEALKRLKEDYNLYLLSNTNEIHWTFLKENTFTYKGEKMTSWFKHLFLSYELHLEKPEAEIFQAVLDIAGIKAEDSLFIDDNQTNLDGAAKLGIHTLLSKDGDRIPKLLK